ncbi:MAG TPA: sugar transferase [Chloroflexota bacterium]|jgi:lipopolysaccharide/colanic/teichoic acid biosynthesis glycosyltransferase
MPVLEDGVVTVAADLESYSHGNVQLAADPRARAIKRTMDIVLSSVALVFLSPLLALIAVGVLLDSPGPVLFRQERIGKYGRSFVMLKFRTMFADRRRRNTGPPPGMAERRHTHKSPNDPRITWLGRFLRRTCLDELPQFWNVLRGSMSLVGPRPELPEIVANYEPWQHARHLAAPGITGWWQVNRDGVHLMHQATELDLFYLEHWSVGLDLRILARTLSIVLDGVGAF